MPSPPIPAWAATNALFRRHRRRLLPLLLPSSLRSLLPVLSHAIVSGLARNPFVASRLLLSFSQVSLPFSLLLLSHLPTAPSTFSFNSLIRASPSSIALHLFHQMLRTNVRPDHYTLPFLLHSSSCCSPRLGQSLHAYSFHLGYAQHLFTQTAVLNMYFACGSVVYARLVFGEMGVRDVVAWTAMISGLAGVGLYLEAVQVFREMRGCEDAAASPHVATLVSVASACAGLGSLEHAKGLHAYAEKAGLERELFVRNALIDMYGKCGSIGSARGLFNLMCEKDLHSWTAMITGLASHGLGKEALDLFSGMKQMRVVPDSTTFIAVLSACSHAGLVDEGVNIFYSMESVYKITPDIKHYGCMVDLFSRAGRLSRAYEFIATMPFEPNLAILGALLSACSVNNELEIGELVLKKIESVCRYKGGANVLLSNIYANQNQWHEVASIREKMRKDASKPPGQSSIEVGGAVHEFIVEDRSHPLSLELLGGLASR